MNGNSADSEAKTPRARWVGVLLLLAILVLAMAIHFLGIGSQDFGFRDRLTELFHPTESPIHNYLWNIACPRVLACVATGGILGLVGAAFQGLFRNPLAEPYVVGVSSGSAVGGAIAIATGFGAGWVGFAQNMGPLILGFPAGVISLMVVVAIASRRGVMHVQTLLLAGVVTGAMLSALLSMILLWGGQDTNKILNFLLGSMTPMFWNWVIVMYAVLVIGGWILVSYSKQLNLFAVGEDSAQRLGVNVRRLKPVILVTGAAMVATTVGAIGIIGFLGLVSPHLARRILGVDWRVSLLGSGILGAALLCLSDEVAQHAIKSTEFPVGVVTAVLGAPFLLVLLKRKG